MVETGGYQNNAELSIRARFSPGCPDWVNPGRQQKILYVSREKIWPSSGPKDDQKFKNMGVFFLNYFRHLDPGFIL
jgi:hypothetical protein